MKGGGAASRRGDGVMGGVQRLQPISPPVGGSVASAECGIVALVRVSQQV